MLKSTINSPQHKRVFLMTNNNQNDTNQTNKSNKIVLKIQKIREIHLELIKCARNINDAYGFHILLSVTTTIIIFITSAYYLYNYILTEDYDQISLYIYWNIYFILFFNEIIIYFFFLHAMNTGDILCELYEPSTSKEFRAEVFDFTLQLLQNPLSFTSCGFFDLDYTLIRNIISIMITYFVILIQIGNTPSNIFIENSTLSNSSDI
ncbi:hypothetical protein M0804_011231 [Polistes exclamans]|nr:hypothetical protein M0804_011231 [Polistes exclamans]